MELPLASVEGLKMPAANWKTLVMAAWHSGSPLPMMPPGSGRALRNPAARSESLELPAANRGAPGA